MTIGLAIAGYGYWGQKIAKTISLLPDFTLSAIVDTDPRALASAYQEFPTVQQYSSWDIFFRNAHVDALWVAVPVGSHASLAIQALNAGLDVLVEKALASSIHQAEQIRDAVTNTGRILLPGHIYLHDVSIRQLRQIIQDVSLGDVCYLDMTRTGYGIIRPDMNVIWDLAVHDIIISLFLLNEIPDSVSAWGSSFIYPEQTTIASLLLSFQSGKRVVIQSSWLEAARRRQITVVGVQGMATLTDMGSHQLLQISEGSLKALVPGQQIHTQSRPIEKKQYSIPTTEGLKAEAQHFAACIQKKVNPVCNIHDGLQVIRILEAAQLSLMKGGKEIRLNHIAST